MAVPLSILSVLLALNYSLFATVDQAEPWSSELDAKLRTTSRSIPCCLLIVALGGVFAPRRSLPRRCGA